MRFHQTLSVMGFIISVGGRGSTVIEIFSIIPSTVAVMVAVPSVIPVIIPDASTVTTFVLSEVQIIGERGSIGSPF